MPIISQTNLGIVTGLWGTALIRSADGKMRVLKMGDEVNQGDQLLTTQAGIVQLGPNDIREVTPRTLLAANDVAKVIEGLEKDEPEFAPGAGLSGDDAGLGASYRVERIAEFVPSGGLFAQAGSTTPTGREAALLAPELFGATTPALTISNNSISATEDGPSVGLGIAPLSGVAPGATVQINQVPAVGQILTANGTAVLSGSVIAAADLPGLMYVPPTDYVGGGAGQFIFTVNGPTGPVPGSVAIALAAINDAPTASAGSASGLEDAALQFGLGGQDVDGAVTGVTITDLPASGALFLADGSTPVTLGQTLSATQANQLVYRPGSDFNGNVSITFTVTDDGGAVSAPATYSFAVLAVNDAPVSAPLTISTIEDTPVSGNVLATASDVEGDALSVTQFSIDGATYPAGSLANVAGIGTLRINGDGSFVFTPAANFAGPVPAIAFTISDGRATTNTGLAIDVAGVNDAPVATVDSVVTLEDTAVVIDVLGNDTDADADRLNVVAINGNAIAVGSPVNLLQGVVSLNPDGTLTLTPNPNFNGAVTFTYTVSDGTSATLGAVNASVTAVNDAPVARSDLASTPIGTPVSIAVLANDSDVEGDALSVTSATLASPAHGTVSVAPDGSLLFTPAPGFSGPSTITYAVVDANGAASTGTVTVNVGNNTPPTGTSTTLTLAEDGSRSLSAADFGFTDTDLGQTFANLRIDSLPAAGSLALAGLPVASGQIIATSQLADLVFTPTQNANGTAYSSLGFSVQDSLGAFDLSTRTLAFDVTAVADAAVLSSGSGAVAEDGVLTTGGTLTISDPDAGEASFVAQAGTAGAYGSFTLSAAGAWTYTLNNTTAQALGAGQTISETFTVASLDGTLSTVSVSVSGANDAAVLSSATGAVAEDGVLATGGTLTISDADAGQASFAAQAGTAGTYATFTLSAGGVWTYTLNNAAAQSLGAGQTITETFTVASLDGTASTVSVSVSGANDAAVISSASGAVAEDGVLSTGGTLTISDADAGQASFVAQAGTAGSYGSFTLSAAGVWTYTLNNAAAQSLGAGQTITETFTVAALDGTTSTVSVSVSGANDAAVISNATGAVAEDGVLATGGTLTISDVDAGQASFTAQAGTAGAYGTFTLSAAGAWTYTLNNATAQSLGAGQTVNETFTVASLDGTTSAVSVSVSGANDAGVISSASGAVAEDGVLTTGGTLTISDPDSGQASFVAQAGTAGAYGSFTLSAAGAWTYTLDNAAAQALGAGQTITETFTVASIDGATSTVSVSVSGANDAAVLSSATGAVAEDGALFTGGTLTISDADAGEASFVAQPGSAGAYGSFTLSSAGVWNYTLNNAAAQSLGAAQTITETFTVASLDGTTSTVSVTVSGANDAAVISSASGAVAEDGLLATGGTLTISDADTGEASFVAQPGSAGAYGSFTLSTTGAWTYILNNAAAQALGAGQIIAETFTVASLDGTTSTVSVSVSGANDAAVISSSSGAVAEDGVLAIGGTLTISDADAGEASFVVQAATAGAYGSFTLAADGAWTYTLNNAAAQSLGAGQTVNETFSVASLDGTTSTVTVSVTGANDAAVISSATGAVAEDGVLATGGTLTISDADTGQASFVAQPGSAGAYGSFTLSTTGAWTYTLNNAAAQSLGAGQTITESFTVASLDGTTSAVSVSVSGANDAAVISSATGAVAEDSTLSTGGTLTISDADAGEASFVAQPGTASAYGSFTLSAGGAWTYTLNNAAAQSLGAGQTITETFTVASIDGTSSTVSVSVSGANDAAVISSATGAVAEDGVLATGGTLTIADADSGQDSFVAQAGTAGAYGSFTLSGAGVWNYNLNNAAAQSLGAGQTITETFTVASLDGTTSTVSVSVTGANDAAVISSATGAVAEDGVLATGGTLTITDADAGQASFVAQASTAGAYGSFTLSAAGVWSYSLDNAAAQSLGAGQTITETFTVTALDGTPSTVSVSVSGANDSAVISSATGAVAEDGVLATGGTLTISDVDSGQASFLAQPATAGAYGSFTLSAAGVWTYTLNNSAAQSLGAGQTITETFTVASLDGSTSTVSVTVSGANDAAVLSSAIGAVAEDGVLATGGTLTISDLDSGEAGFLAQAGTAGAYGSFTLSAVGAWTYTLDNAAAQSLGAGQTITETFTASSLDGTTSTVSVSVSGANDAAVISSASGAVAEDAVLATGGTLTISDADAGQASFVAQASTAGAYGSFTLSAAGVWTYSLNNAAAQSLGAGQTMNETFTVSSLDGTTSTVSVSVSGANDAAVISSASGAVAEDGVLATGGTLTISDADAGQASFVAQAGTAGTYGSFTLSSAGVWTYTLNNAAAQSLGGGQTFTETFTVASLDGTTSTVTVSVSGANDAAVLSSATGAVAEDGVLATGGTLTISDVDSGQASFVAQAGTAGAYGNFTLSAAGLWTYALNNVAAQSLGAGQTITETFTVAALDGTTSTVSVSVSGANDAAVISSASGAVAEDGVLSTGGTLTISDADAGQASFVAQAGAAGAYGSFTLSAAGVWAYTLNNATAQSLAAGQAITETFTVASLDGTTSTVTVSVSGANDAPTAVANTVSTAEDTSVTISAASLLANDSDPDNASVLTLSSVQDAVGGTVAINGSGNVVFTPASNFGGPASFTYTVTDGLGGSSTAVVNVDVIPVADTPTLIVLSSVISLQPGAASISTEPGIAQANLETTLGLTAGQLDTLDPPAGTGGVTTNDPGTVNVSDGKVTSYTLNLGSGNVANFGWQFFNGEDSASEINNGYNDMVVLVVTDPAGNRQLIQISSSEQVGPNVNGAAVDGAGNYQFTATSAGAYQFAWLVANGRDGNKDSSLNVAAPTITTAAGTFGLPVPLVIGTQLADRDGSEVMTVTVTGVPAGAAFSAGTNLGGGSWSFTAAQLSGLNFLPAVGFTGTVNLSVTATATEPNGSTATSAAQTIAVTVESTTSTTMGSEIDNTITGAPGNDLIEGFVGNDVISGNDGNDLIYGGSGNDTLSGGNGLDTLYGGAGTDTLNGGTGNDKLYGGAGNDALTGGTGVDVFAWTLADRGPLGTPATDTITDFNLANPASGGDLLDLRDLLQGEAKAGLSPGTLEQFLDFDTTSSAGNTIIRISSNGGFAGGTYSAGAEDQRIILQGVDLRSAGAFGLSAAASDNDIIQQLLQRGKLVTDGT